MSTQPPIQALLFDVFGTLVDWHATIIRTGQRRFGQRFALLDWPAFAEAWRAGYRPKLDAILNQQAPWRDIDAIHREILDELAPRFGLETLKEDERADFNLVWHQLDGWPDSAEGLGRLRCHFTVATLSNGSEPLLRALSAHAGLGWDHILSADLLESYKPDPAMYRQAVARLGLNPDQVMMVTAHLSDLRAARSIGLKTAYIPRPDEYGKRTTFEPHSASHYDLTAPSLTALADLMLLQH